MLCMMKKLCGVYLIISLVLVVAASSNAVITNYGDLSANHFFYRQIMEDSTTDSIPLYGSPSTAGDALIFSPMSFGIVASNGSFDYMDGTLAATIDAVGNSTIGEIRFAETGDYSLGGNGTSATNASVSASLFVRIVEVDRVSINPVSYSTNFTFSPSDGTYDLINDPGMGKIWNGSVYVDVAAILAANNIIGNATKVNISLDNMLMAFSEPGTLAYIKKKQIERMTIETIPIPEPATILLLVIGGLTLIRRHRKA